ncbi:hypothetical protein D3C76_1384880 [compost metagenome]
MQRNVKAKIVLGCLPETASLQVFDFLVGELVLNLQRVGVQVGAQRVQRLAGRQGQLLAQVIQSLVLESTAKLVQGVTQTLAQLRAETGQ